MSEYLKHFLKKNSAVIITGGSSGIGKCFIQRIVNIESKFPICNISRSDPGIILQNKSSVHFSCDLAEKLPSEQLLETLTQFLENTDKNGEITLINNSGVGAYGPFQNIDVEQQYKMIQLNICAVVHLTGLLLPFLMKRGGTVINIASTAAFQPTPYLSTYGATKSFLLDWSLALNQDLKGTKARVLCVCPGPTATNFFKAAGFSKSPLPKGIGQTSDQVVDATMKAFYKNKSLVVSGLSNKVISGLSSFMPKTLVAPISSALLKKVRAQ